MKLKFLFWKILFVLSIISILVTSFAIGFYNNIVNTGFYPDLLFMFTLLFSLSILLISIVRLKNIL